MNQKKTKLIETGLSLFAEKGYHQTSIQEIATEAGISKGAFYLYFQSKEDFIATAFQYFNTKITEKMDKIPTNLEPKQILAEQITILIDYIYTYKGFITMHLRENISIGEKTDAIIKRFKVQNYQWMRDNIRNVYGDQVNAILTDCIVQFEGLINSYFKWIVIDDIQMDRSKIGEYLVRRLDDLVYGMINRNEPALIKKIPNEYETNESNVEAYLHSLQEKIKSLPIKAEQITELQEVVTVLTGEIKKEEPQKVLIQGLLAHFNRYPVLHDECEQIANYLSIELLH